MCGKVDKETAAYQRILLSKCVQQLFALICENNISS